MSTMRVLAAAVVLAALLAASLAEAAAARTFPCGREYGGEGRYVSVRKSGPVNCAMARRVARAYALGPFSRDPPGWRCRISYREPVSFTCRKGAARVYARYTS